MPIPLTYPRKTLSKKIIIEEGLFPDKTTEWVTWFYCGLMKNQKSKSQPLAIVAFRSLKNGMISDECITRRVALTELGQVRIGTIWRDKDCISELVFPLRRVKVNFTKGNWSHSNFYSSAHSKTEAPYDISMYPLPYKNDKNYFLNLTAGDKHKLTIPCLEFFSRCYGRSQEIKRILATYRWDDAQDRMFAPLEEPEEQGKWKVKLKQRLYNGDALFAAHIKYDKYTSLAAKKIYGQIESQFDEGINPIFIKVDPWFEGEATLLVRGIELENGSFLVLRILGCSEPQGDDIFRDRDNTNKTDAQVLAGNETKAWDGRPMRKLSTPPEIINIVSDHEPTHGSSTVEVQDPEFVILGKPRSIVDVNRNQAKSSSGKKIDVGEGNIFSSGEHYGTGNYVGYASLHAKPIIESQGVLRDMWNAFLYFKTIHSEIIQSVEWFTFDDGFSDKNQPQLIALAPFEKNDDVITEIRHWPYIDVKTQCVRGLLIIRITTPTKVFHICEIQRKIRKKKDNEENYIDTEESFQGLVFEVYSDEQFKEWMKSLTDKIRYAKGVMQKLVTACPGIAYSFSHSPADSEAVECEAAAINALEKIGAIKKGILKCTADS